MRAEPLVDPLVPPLAREVEVELAEPHSSCLQHPENPRDRDRDPVGPVAELVAELVDRLLELEDGQQPLDRLPAGRQQGRLDGREVAVEELRCGTAPPSPPALARSRWITDAEAA